MLDKLKNQIISAPLAGLTNEPLRLLFKDIGLKITYTEMVSADALIRREKKTLGMVTLKYERPIVIPQIFGSDPDILSDAAKILHQMGYTFVDINMGCPVRKVNNRGSGVKLMDNPDTVRKIIHKLREIPVVISVKLRLGVKESTLNYLDIINILYNEGVDFVTLHPRSGEEFFKNSARWSCIKEVKDKFPKLFLIGNGDIKSPEDIEQMFLQTGCDAVMIGRKLSEDPLLIQQWEKFKEDGSYQLSTPEKKMEIFKTLFNYINLFYNQKISTTLARKYLFLFSKGFSCSADFRKKISLIKNCIEILEEISYWEKNYKTDRDMYG